MFQWSFPSHFRFLSHRSLLCLTEIPSTSVSLWNPFLESHWPSGRTLLLTRFPPFPCLRSKEANSKTFSDVSKLPAPAPAPPTVEAPVSVVHYSVFLSYLPLRLQLHFHPVVLLTMRLTFSQVRSDCKCLQTCILIPNTRLYHIQLWHYCIVKSCPRTSVWTLPDSAPPRAVESLHGALLNPDRCNNVSWLEMNWLSWNH